MVRLIIKAVRINFENEGNISSHNKLSKQGLLNKKKLALLSFRPTGFWPTGNIPALW